MKKIIALAVIIFAMTSCSKYYKTVMGNTGENSAKTIDSLINASRYFVFRNSNRAFAMNNIVINNDTKTVQCMLDVLPDEHRLHLTNGVNGKMRYKELNGYQLDSTPVLNEVHLYNSIANNTVNVGPYTLPLSQVKKIEIIEQDKEKTRKSKTTGMIISVGLVVLAGVGIVSIALTSSFLSLF